MSLGSGGGRSVCLWRCRLLSVPSGEQVSGRMWDCSGLGHVTRRCFGTKWYDEVPGARSTRDGKYAMSCHAMSCHVKPCHVKYDKYAMFSFAMTSGLASDFDKFEIIMTLRHGVPEMMTPAMRTTTVLLGFLNLTNMPCLVLP